MEIDKEKYYDITKNTKPHSNLIKFLNLNLPPQKAIDLGCGAGRDTIALLKNNWEVLAIDKEDTESIIKEQLTVQELKKFKFSNSVFGQMNLPKVNLIVANFSLPFAKKEYFNLIWDKINNSIINNRLLCREFFWKKRFVDEIKKRFSIFI